MVDSPNRNIPVQTAPPPLVVCRGVTPEQLEADLLSALASGYEPEPGLMCTRNNEVWVICYLRTGDEPEPASPPQRQPQQQQPQQQPPQGDGNVNENLARSVQQ